MKDLTDQNELAKQIPTTATEFRFGNMILKITKSKNGTYGMIIKNTENSKFHHTLVAKDKPSFHYTKESDGIIPNQHVDIDFLYLQQEIGRQLQNIFTSAQKITIDDARYSGKKTIMLVSQKMIIEKKTAKKVTFDQEIEYEESLFENIDTKHNRMGFILDENGNEQWMILIQNRDIFKLDLEQFEPENSTMDKVIRPQFHSI